MSLELANLEIYTAMNGPSEFTNYGLLLDSETGGKTK